jgi:uncharacterized cupin superfamily protein
MPKIDIDAVPADSRTGYPEPYRKITEGRSRKRLGNVVGLSQFGVNLCRLKPGAASSQRHWHAVEDEFVYVLEGEVVLVTDAGEALLRAGDCAGFKAGVQDGHHLQNRSDREAVVLEVGARSSGDGATYPDIDLMLKVGETGYSHRDGTPYPSGPGRSR